MRLYSIYCDYLGFAFFASEVTHFGGRWGKGKGWLEICKQVI